MFQREDLSYLGTVYSRGNPIEMGFKRKRISEGASRTACAPCEIDATRTSHKAEETRGENTSTFDDNGRLVKVSASRYRKFQVQWTNPGIGFFAGISLDNTGRSTLK
jgi:hypothetical protein